MQPRKTTPGAGRTPDVPQSPQGDEYIDIDKAVEETEEDDYDEAEEEDEDLELESEEDERGDDRRVSGSNKTPDETKDITV